MVKTDGFAKGATEGKNSQSSKRAEVLNKVFMRYITEIMSTGQYSSELVGNGIEINRVCMINIFSKKMICLYILLGKNHSKLQNFECILDK